MFFKKLVIIQILASAVFFVNTASAAPLTFNVDGVISDSTDQPLTAASVTFTVQVKDSAETCLLYQESFPVSMTGSNGYFSLVVGKQTNAVSGGSTLDKVFSNSGAAIPGQSCTYTPTLKTETRKIIVSFDEGSGSQIFSSQEIQSVPYAVAAGEATKFTGSLSGDVTGTQSAAVVGKIKGLPVDTTGIADGKILKYQSGTFVVADDLQGTSGITSFNGLTSATQSFNAIDLGNSVLAPAWVSSGSAHTLKIPMASGTSVTGGLISNSDFVNFSTKITALTGDITASGSGTVNAVIGAGKVTSSHILDGTINGADVDFTATNSATSDLVLKDSGTGKFATFACSTPNYVLTWTAAGWSCQAPATTGLPLSGGTMTGAISMGSNNLLNVGNLTMVAGGYLTLPNTATNGTSAGQVWYDAGNIKYYDGSAVKTVSTGSSGMSNALSTGQVWVGNVSGGAEARSLNGDIASTSATGAVVVNKTTSGAANTILSLDGSSVGTMSGVALVNSGTVTLSASSASSTYGLKLPAAAPTGTQVMQVDASGNLTWIATPSFSMPALSAGKIWIGNASNGIAAQTMGGDATIDNAGVLTLKNTGTIGTYYRVITDAQGRVTSGSALTAADITTALTYTPLNKAADTMSGDLGTQNINMAANKYLKLSTNGTDGTVAGQVWYDAGIIKYFDGTTVKSLGVAGAGITNLNGLSGSSQSLAIGTAGNAPAFASATTTHTLNIPMASASGTVTAGLISNTDYVSFSGKQNNSLTSGSVWVGNSSGGAQARTLGGDITIDNTGSVTLKNTGTAGAYYKVTTDAQGRVVSGSASLSATDLPSLPDGKIWIGNSGNTAVSNTMGGDATISNTGVLTLKNVGTAGAYFKVNTDAQGRVTSGSALASSDVTTALGYTPTAAGTGYVNGGNTFAGNATIGLNDAYNLSFKTNAATRMTLTSSGNLGIGTATPSGVLEVQGGTAAASTAGSAITLKAQDGGSGGAAGGNIILTPGAGSSGWPDGTVVVTTTNGQSGAIYATNNATNTYATSSASNTSPSYVLKLANSYSANGNTALIEGSVRNANSIYQESYMGFVSVSGAANYSADFVMGMSTGPAAYSERLRVVGATGNVGIGTSSPAYSLDFNGKTDAIRLPAGTTAQQPVNTAGLIRYNTTNNNVEFNNGTTWTALGVAGAGITSLNGLTSGAQTFATGTTGTDFNLSFSGITHTFNLPSASASNRGALTSADWSTFNAKQGNALVAGSMWVGNSSGGAQSRAISGDITIDNVGFTTLKNTGTAGAYFKVTTDAQGRVISGAALASGDVTTALGYTPTSAGSGYVNGGNTFGAAATIGTTDGFSFALRTNSVDRLTITSTGKVGIGTGSPSTSLDLSLNSDAIYLPKGNNAARPGSPAAGMLRFNSTSNTLEYHDGTSWYSVGNALGYTPLNKAGDAMTGALGMGGFDITNTGNITMAANKYFTLSNNTTSGTAAGQMWYDAGVIKYYDGTTVKSLGVAGAGITSLNGLTTGTQTFGNGITGTSPSFSSAGSGHILNIPMANTASVTAGLLSKTEYDTFNAKQSTVLGAGQVWVGNASGASEARTLSGDIASVSNVGLVTVDKTTMGVANKILSLDGTGVGLVRGLDVQTGAGKVTLLTAGAFTNYILTLPNAQGGANQVMSNDGSGNLSWVTPLTSTTAIVNGGNTFAGNATIGTNDNYNLGFKTNSTTRMTITSAGNVGIGTANPSGTLDVQGGTAAASTTGSNINLYAQNGGTGGAAGGNINLIPGLGSSGFQGGSVMVDVTNGNAGAINAANSTTNSYATSSASASNPSYVIRMGNGSNGNNNTALLEGSVRNSSGNAQESYMGFVSVTGAGNYSADFVMGMSSASNAYSEKLRVQGSTGNVGIGTSSPAYSLDFNGKTDAIRLPAGTTAQQPANIAGLFRYNTSNAMVEYNNSTSWNTLVDYGSAQTITGAKTFSGVTTISNGVFANTSMTLGAGTNAITAGNGNIAMGTGGTSVAGGGQFYGAAYSSSTNTIDFNKGNSQTTSYDCASGNITLNNMQSGGSYTLIVTSTTTNKCNLYDGGTLISDTQFSPINGVRTSGVSTVYRINKLGSSVYAQWAAVGTSVAAGFVNGGNTYSGNASIGLNDAFNLNFMTGATTRMTINSAGNIGIGTASPAYSMDFSGKTDAIRLPAGTTAQQPTALAGLIRYNTSNSNVEFNNGTTWTALAAAGAGITSLNGLTGTSQTFATPGTSGTAPAWSFAGSTHTLNIPMANTVSVTAGLISKTEYDTFNSKLNGTLASGNIFVGNASGGAVGVGMSGDATISNAGLVTVTKTTTGQVNKILSLDGSGVATMLGLNLVNSGTVSLQAQSASSSYILRLPASSPSANQIMVSDASGNLSWATNPALGYTPVNKAGDTMTGTLEVSGNIQTNQGQVYASQNLVSSGATVDFNTGNVQIVQSPGGASITLNNMKDGGSYTLIVTDSTSRQYTFPTCTNPHFVPANDLTTAGTQSIYTILKVTIGGATHCYISWVTGF